MLERCRERSRPVLLTTRYAFIECDVMNARKRSTPKLPEHLTIRGVPRAVALALDKERRRRGLSLNRTVIDVMKQGLGITRGGVLRSNGLRQFAGTWSAQDARKFDEALAASEQIDAELWR